MLPSSVAKCMTTNYYATIYDHDHSKHINDHPRCRRDNGATCLNCKVDFFFPLEMLTAVSLLSSDSPPPTTTTPLLLKCKQSGSVTLPSPPTSHSHYLCSLARALSISPYLSLPFPVCVCESLSDQRQLCDTCARRPGSRKHQTTEEQLAKKTQGHMRACVRVCVCDKQVNKLTRRERDRERDDFVSTFSTSMKGRKVSL